MGPLPRPQSPVPLDIKVLEEVQVGKLIRRKVTYRSDANDVVPAYLMFPINPAQKQPAILCLHQTTAFGKDEPAGIRGDADLRYALELAERGYTVIVPDYPSLGEHHYDFAMRTEYVSGSMKAVWDNIRAVDVLLTLWHVDPDRIGVIGHSLGGHNAIFTALFEPRLKAIVCSCGFTTFRKDDLPSWNGPRYMPRLATDFGNEIGKVPFDFDELIAALAPRAFFASAAENDDDFDVAGVREIIATARNVYQRYGTPDRLEAFYPPTQHAFPQQARTLAYSFLDRRLKGQR